MKQSLKSLRDQVKEGRILSWLTCYDYSFASALSETELDMILVGDSGGMVSLGYSDTVPVTMDEMILLTKAVRRGAPNKFIVGDMPKGSYEISDVDAVRNAMRFLKEGGCDAIKLEGAGLMAQRVSAIVNSGIPVIGHIGLTPQSSSSFGGYRVVGKSKEEEARLLDDALTLQEAGAFAVLLEAVPPAVGKALTEKVGLLTFGIGAGQFTHGQLLILHDLLGLYPNFRPKFAKCYIPDVTQSFVKELEEAGDLVSYGRSSRLDGVFRLTVLAVNQYLQEVKSGKFPSEEFSYLSKKV